MVTKRGFIRVQFEDIEGRQLVEVMEKIEAIIEAFEGASVEMNLTPERRPGSMMSPPMIPRP